MCRKVTAIIGIIIFILIVSCTYTNEILSFKSNDKKANTIEQAEIIYKGKLAMPIENFITTTSKFGYRDPIYKDGVQISGGKLHSGLDLCGSLGSRVIAVKDGEVTYAGWQSGYGNCVEIKHIDEEGNIFYSFYGHMRDNSLCVQNGQNVITGQVLGVQGNTGNSSGEHLHFEIRTENKEKVDPAPYIFTEKEG